MKWLIASGLRRRDDESELRYKQLSFDEGGEDVDEYLQIFRNEVRMRGVEAFLRIPGSSRDSSKEGGRSNVLLGHVNACEATVVGCSTERETRGGRRQRLYVDKKRSNLELAVEQLIDIFRVLVQH